jgi:signal peptidase II
MANAAPPNAASQGWLWGPWARLGLKVAVATFILDQVNKWAFIAGLGMVPGQKIVLTPFLDLLYTINTGVSYSMLDSASYSWQLGLAAFAVVASLALWIWLNMGEMNRIMAWAIGLIIGGAIGNAVDRVIIGGVADFYSLHAFGFYWYVFNIADVAIVAGVALLLYDSFIASRNDAANPL